MVNRFFLGKDSSNFFFLFEYDLWDLKKGGQGKESKNDLSLVIWGFLGLLFELKHQFF